MKPYAWVTLSMAACTALGTLILPLLSVTDVAMLFLVVVGLVAARFERGPSIFAAFLSIALFDFFFVPPRFTFAVDDLHYVLTFGVMLVAALVISAVASRLREHAEAARERERRTATLYAMSHELLWQAAGVGTTNFPDAPMLFLPLVGAGGRLGVLAVRPDEPALLREPVVRQVLETFAGQSAVAVERVRAMRAEAAESSPTG